MTPVVERKSLVLRGVLDLCVLALLQERPVYGYEISQRLAEQGLLMSGGSTYPLLARLEKAGLVSTHVLPSSTGPPRKYYSMTAAGHTVLRDGMVEWSTISEAVTGLLGAKTSARTQEATHD